ncbi:MAG TPA: hypothetical protein VFG20_15660 [Planctomycetaceae bacterium]|jgi:hypothetical protein|nr:hypothetical protein [Planctomycetaceae bacterium]
MLAPLVLPLQITCVVVGLLSLIVAMLWQRIAKRPRISFFLMLVTSIGLFVPTLLVVSLIVDEARYGKQEFATGAQVVDRYVEVPASATNIILHKYASGHELRMNVDEDALLAWMDAVTKKSQQFARDATPFEKDESFGRGEYFRHIWKTRFAKYGWEAPPDIVQYKGWRSARGSGFDVYYSPQSQTAFISAAYW